MPGRITGREQSAILSSLAAGVVPSVGLHHIQVGRKDEVNALLTDLAKVEDDAAFVRFVVGQFGSGKTFFLNLIRTVALERKFVVATADITTQRRLHGTGGRARALYSELMGGIASRSRPNGGALPNIIERWVSDLDHKVTSSGGTTEDVSRHLHETCKPLQDLVSGYDFAKVIEQYYRGFIDGNEVVQQAAIRWLRGEYTTKTEARQDLNVRTIIDDSSFYDYLKLMAAFVRIAGYAGLIVCIDELVVLSHRLNNKTARNNNYEAILRILNDCLQGSVQGLGFIFAATNECMEDKRRGLFSYEALATRLAPNRFATSDVIDFSGPVLRLASLTPEDCFVLLDKIRQVHVNGNDTKRTMPDEAIEGFLQNCNQRMGAAFFQTPRETVKDFVGLLNVLEQNANTDWRTQLGTIKTSAADASDPYLTVTDLADGPDEPSPHKTDGDLSSFKL